MSLEMAKRAVKALDDKKGHDIQVIDISKLSSIGDYFIMCTGNSTTQVKALADEVEYQLKEFGLEVECHREGYGSASWILLDYKDIIVHIFQGETREFYNLEHLWADGEKLDIKTLLEE